MGRGSAGVRISFTQIAGKECVDSKGDVEGEFEENRRTEKGNRESNPLAGPVDALGVARLGKFKADGAEQEEERGFTPHDIPTGRKQGAQRGDEPSAQDERGDCRRSQQTKAPNGRQLIEQCAVRLGTGRNRSQSWEVAMRKSGALQKMRTHLLLNAV